MTVYIKFLKPKDRWNLRPFIHQIFIPKKKNWSTKLVDQDFLSTKILAEFWSINMVDQLILPEIIYPGQFWRYKLFYKGIFKLVLFCLKYLNFIQRKLLDCPDVTSYYVTLLVIWRPETRIDGKKLFSINSSFLLKTFICMCNGIRLRWES